MDTVQVLLKAEAGVNLVDEVSGSVPVCVTV